MKSFITLLLVLCTQLLSVHSAAETPCDPASATCDCDLSKFTAAVPPPVPTVECLSGVMNIYMPKCQLIKNQYSASNLALNDNTVAQCGSAEYIVNNEAKVTFHNPMKIGQCGNNVTINDTHVTYSNILHIYPGGKLVTRSNVTADVSCSYPLNYNNVQLNVTLHPTISKTQLPVPGAVGAMTVTMAAYTDAGYTSVITSDTVLTVEQIIYFSISIPELDGETLSIKVLSIYAGPGGTAPNTEYFNLTTGSNGCPDLSYGSELISMTKNGDGSEARFTLKVFKITNYDDVNIYADVTLCKGKCITTCGVDTKSDDRSSDGNVASVGIELTASETVFSGAVDRFPMPWTLFSLISSLLCVKLM